MTDFRRVTDDFSVAGTSTVQLTVTPRGSTDATLFVGLRDLAPDGTYTLVQRYPPQTQVPGPLRLPLSAAAPVVAVGAELKSTFCIARGHEAFLSPHLGDLDSEAAKAR